jgi:hypothetical protein
MSLAAILKRLDAIEAKLNLDRTTGNWIRGWSGELIWDSWDMDAVDNGAAARLHAELETMAERLRAQPDWTEPTEAQKAEAMRGLDEAVERMRAERQALRDFTAYVEAELARGVPLGEIRDPA